MAKLLFKLNSVPDDEADEIREVLDGEQIDYYETSSGNWGLSFAAIWLKDEQQFDQAKALIDDYQRARYQRVIEERETLIANGEQTSWWQAFKHHPIKVTAVVIFVAAVLYLSIVPFFGDL